MEPILIYQDNSKINEVKSMRQKHQDYLQEFLTEVLSLDITLTIPELISLATFGHNIQMEYQQNKIYAFVQNKLVEKAGAPNFNGVPINTTMLKELIEIPNLNDVYALLDNYVQYRRDGFGIDPAYFKLEGALLVLSDNSDSLIENTYTYYTKNDAGVEYTTSLLSVCSALNSHNNKYPFHVSNVTFNNGLGMPVKGIEIRNMEFVPSIQAIRDIEERYADYVAPVGG